MDFLELKIDGLLQSKNLIFFASVVLSVLPLPPSLQTFFYFYNALGTFSPKIMIPAQQEVSCCFF